MQPLSTSNMKQLISSTSCYFAQKRKKWKSGEEASIHPLNIIERYENDLHVCLITREESFPLLFT